MAETIIMPDLGFEAGSGELSVWLKKVGDSIQAGEPIAEVESDKVTLELESPVSGILLELLIQPGENAPVGSPIASVGAAEELTAPPPDRPAHPLPRPPEPQPQSTHTQVSPQAEKSPLPGKSAPEQRREEPLGTPIALRMAREHNLDLARVTASGPGGRILRADVENFLAQQSPIEETRLLPSESVPRAESPDAVASGRDQSADSTPGAPMSPLRRAIAQRMSQSKETIPHFYITNSVVMDEAAALRKQINRALPPDDKITVNDMVMKAAALALRAFPNLNASYVDDRILHHPDIHIGAAVAVEGGVLTVVSRQTDRSAISEMARANRAMIQRARGGRVRPEDVSGSTFTISNLGGYDTDHFAAIINPPQAAILGVATARERAVVEAGELKVRTVLQLTISADHRVTDGAECARFLQKVKELLETPIKLLLE